MEVNRTDLTRITQLISILGHATYTHEGAEEILATNQVLTWVSLTKDKIEKEVQEAEGKVKAKLGKAIELTKLLSEERLNILIQDLCTKTDGDEVSKKEPLPTKLEKPAPKKRGRKKKG
jgi:hypothetical protein